MYGRLYLNLGLFKELAQRFKRNVVLILAERDGKVREFMAVGASEVNPIVLLGRCQLWDKKLMKAQCSPLRVAFPENRCLVSDYYRKMWSCIAQ